MTVKVPRLGEPEVADLASVRFFPTMYSLVLGQSGGVGKTLAAVVTPIRPLTRVGAQVGRDGGALGEAFLADGAAERLFSAVGTKMGRQVGCLGERLATNITAVRLFPTVSPHVGLEGGRSGIALATDLTDVVTRLSRSPRLASSRRTEQLTGHVADRAVHLGSDAVGSVGSSVANMADVG